MLPPVLPFVMQGDSYYSTECLVLITSKYIGIVPPNLQRLRWIWELELWRNQNTHYARNSHARNAAYFHCLIMFCIVCSGFALLFHVFHCLFMFCIVCPCFVFFVPVLHCWFLFFIVCSFIALSTHVLQSSGPIQWICELWKFRGTGIRCEFFEKYHISYF